MSLAVVPVRAKSNEKPFLNFNDNMNMMLLESQIDQLLENHISPAI